MLSDQPKLLGERAAVEARLKELQATHVRLLTDFVHELRREAGPSFEVPYFDPWDGGVDATALFLLEAPGPKAVRSSFVSRNNPDETAKNFYELNMRAGLPRKSTVVWNAVPWYIGDGKRIRAANPQDLSAGLRPLPRLLGLLPKLRAIILVGRKAERAATEIDHSKYKIFRCPHPSPMFVNNAPGNRDKILTVLKEVTGFVVQPGAAADGPRPAGSVRR